MIVQLGVIFLVSRDYATIAEIKFHNSPMQELASHSVSPQLSLGLELEPSVHLRDFEKEGNEQVLAHVEQFIENKGEHFIYLYGPGGAGKTHLLQSVCSVVMEHAESAIYVSLNDHATYSEEMFQNLESLSLICIDDVDAIAGDPVWEEALFHLYNAVFINGTRLLMAGSKLPVHLGFSLGDLTSRLAFGLSLPLLPLKDSAALVALERQANEVGVHFSQEVGQFLLHHTRRDMQSMYQVFMSLKDASCLMQRKLTVPFVKEVLKL